MKTASSFSHTFGRAKSDDDSPIDPLDLGRHGDDLVWLLESTRAIFHALFCVWHYENETQGAMEYDSIEPLTSLGQDLCHELDQRIGGLHAAAKEWKNRADAATKEA